MTLKARVKAAFTQTDHEASLICDVVKDTPELMRRNAQLMVLVCTAAGWPEPACDQWIGQELRAALTQARQSTKAVDNLRFTLAIDHPPRLIRFHVQEIV